MSRREPGERWKLDSTGGLVRGEETLRVPGSRESKQHCASSVCPPVPACLSGLHDAGGFVWTDANVGNTGAGAGPARR